MKIENCNFKSNLQPKNLFLYTYPVKEKQAKISTANVSEIKLSAIIPAVYFHPSFGSNNPAEKISNFLDKLLSSSDNRLIEASNSDIAKAFKALIKSGNILGSGKEGIVHKIDNKYVFKINYDDRLTFDSITFPSNNIFDQLKNWYGNILVKIGAANILRNANPHENAISCGTPLNIFGKENIIEYYNKIYLPKLSSLPQNSYDELANDFTILNNIAESQKTGYMFDIFNPNNFLIVKNKINIVDDIDTIPGCKNSLNSMLNPLLCKYKIHYPYTPVFDENLTQMRKEIFKKCIFACEKAEVPFNTYLNDGDIFNYPVLLSGFKTDGKIIQNDIIDFRKNIPEITQRIASINEYLNKIP